MYETPEITRNELRKQSGHGGYDPFIPPPEFPVPPHLRWLWLSNTNYADPAILAKLGDHFAPLIARGLNPYWVGDPPAVRHGRVDKARDIASLVSQVKGLDTGLLG